MTQLTNEERARVFAMYYSNNVRFLSGGAETVVRMDGNVLIDMDIDRFGSGGHYKLLLTPLSKITDEHAIEVAKVISASDFKWGISRVDNMINITNKFFRLYMDTDKCELMLHGRVQFSEFEYSEYKYPKAFDFIYIIDHLRSLGYALPYKGQSLFELGIAIDKTTLKL